MKTNLTITIAVSGAAETGHCGPNALPLAKELGRQIAQHEALMLNGGITGFPMWAAMGAQEAGGTVISFSPAVSAKEHRDVYRLPLDHINLPVYTGFGYAGRDLLMVRSADAVVFGCGKIGTISEFATAYEEDKVIGILEGDWKTDKVLAEVAEEAGQKNRVLIFDKDPRRLVEQVIKKVKERRMS